MRSKLVLLDIDGTILLTGGAGGRAMTQVGVELFGDAFRWDGINPAGALDPGLFREAMAVSGLEYSDEMHQRFHDRYVELFAVEIAAARERDEVTVMPRMHELIERLHATPSVELGLLTGNYRATARLKLEAIDIDPDRFRISAFGGEAETRPALVRLAMDRAHESFERRVLPSQVVVVGDTPKDVACALENDCWCFAVATGSSSVDDLLAAGAQHAVESFADMQPLLSFLDSLD